MTRRDVQSFAMATAFLSLTLVSLGAPANAQIVKPTGATPIAPHAYHGAISSVQFDGKDAPTWIQSGGWMLKIVGTGSAVTGYRVEHTFRASFSMVKPDGTAMHRHTVSDLKVLAVTNENGVYSINGTATVTMKDGPVKDVPVVIKIMNDSVMAIWIGPGMVNGHFGTGPLYGTAILWRAYS
jgi:hypothetical protein